MHKDYEIHDRVRTWIIGVLRLLQKIPKNTITQSIIPQLADSVTSVGANDREANSAQTSRDFCHKYAVVKKEADESLYWLEIISNLFPNLSKEIELLVNEGQQILRIVSTIIKNTRKTSRQRKGSRS